MTFKVLRPSIGMLLRASAALGLVLISTADCLLLQPAAPCRLSLLTLSTRCRKSPALRMSEVREFDVDIDGASCQNGRLGKVIYDKILQDQKMLYKQRPMPGFKAGTIPPQIMPRIKFAAVEQLCSQTCEAALEEQGVTMLPGQTELSTTNGLEFPGYDIPKGDVPAFVKASKWKPGDDVSFRAFGVKGSPKEGVAGTVANVDAFPRAQTPDGVSLDTSATLW